MTFADGTALDGSVFSYDSLTNVISFGSDFPVYEGDYNLTYTLASQLKPADYREEMHIPVSISMSSCSKFWLYPEGSNFFDRSYTIGDDLDPDFLVFMDVSITDCPFVLSLWNITQLPATQIVNSAYLTLQQPVLKVTPDPMIVDVATFGSLLVYTNNDTHRSQSQLELRIRANRYTGETDYRALNFVLKIEPCKSVQYDSSTVIGPFKYKIGDFPLLLPIFIVKEPLCESSFFGTVPLPAEMPIGFTVTNDTENKQLRIDINSAAGIKAGEYEI